MHCEPARPAKAFDRVEASEELSTDNEWRVFP